MGIALGLAMPMYLGGLGISVGQTLQSAAGPSAPMVALWPPEQFLQPLKPVVAVLIANRQVHVVPAELSAVLATGRAANRNTGQDSQRPCAKSDGSDEDH